MRCGKHCSDSGKYRQKKGLEYINISMKLKADLLLAEVPGKSRNDRHTAYIAL